MKKQYEVEGMTCTACALAIERQLAKVDGVTRVNVNYANEKMVVEYNEELVNESGLSQEVDDIGYKLVVEQPGAKGTVSQPTGNKTEEHMVELRTRLIISLLFTIPLFYISMGPMVGVWVPEFFTNHNNSLMIGLIQLFMSIPVMIVNKDFYTVGFRTLWKKAPNMDSLVAVGTGAAFVYGVFVIFQLAYGYSYNDMDVVMMYRHDLYFESVVVILTLITLGKFFEARAKGKTLKAMEALMELAPEVGTVERDGEQLVLSVDEIYHGDVLIVKAGNKIPLDGTIIDGDLLVDESMLTGESLPLDKGVGETVYAGTLCKTGFVKVQVTKTREETALFNIVKLVEEAQSTKAPIAKMADKISAYFVPAVLIISLVTLIVWLLVGESPSMAFQMAVSVLVISCPCALGLATPTAIMVGTGKGATYGTLIKSGEALEELQRIRTIVFDKTGTLTKGEPTVTVVGITKEAMEQQVLAMAAAVEEQSEHPYAQAVVSWAKDEGYVDGKLVVENYETIPGKGVRGMVSHHQMVLGNQKLMNDYNVNIEGFSEELDAYAVQGKTPLHIGVDGVFAGYIIVEDVVKDDAKALVDKLHDMDVEVVMLTGDHQKTAESIGSQLGIRKVIAEVLPDQKAQVIDDLMSDDHGVAMVGDGINDAVALTKANVGIAIGTGTDVAIESADVVLVKDSLQDVVTAIELSKATIRNIKQNLFWAFFYNVVGIPIAAGVFYVAFGWKLNPMIAAAAMSFSSVSVVTNALRLRGFKPSEITGTNNEISTETNNIKGEEESVDSEELVHIIDTKDNGSEERNVKMKKLAIDGMSCMHCVGRVDKALNALDGVGSVSVDLESNSATVSGEVADDVLIGAVTEAGYDVTGVTEV